MSTNVPSVSGLPITNSFVYTPDPYFDVEDLDPTYSTYPMYGAMGYGMGMGSIFSGAPMMGGMGSTPQDYFNQMKQYQQFYTDYNVDQQKMQRNADLRVNASMEAIQTTYNALKDKINSGEQGQIEDAYNKFVQAVGTAYGTGTEQEIKARAATLYSQLSGGKTIVQDLRDNGHNSFLQGMLHSMAFGLYNSRSSEDNISAITGNPVSTGEKVEQNIGRLAGSAAMGLAAGGIATKFLGAASKGKAGIIGLAVAGASALMSLITGKVTT